LAESRYPRGRQGAVACRSSKMRPARMRSSGSTRRNPDSRRLTPSRLRADRRRDLSRPTIQYMPVPSEVVRLQRGRAGSVNRLRKRRDPLLKVRPPSVTRTRTRHQAAQAGGRAEGVRARGRRKARHGASPDISPGHMEAAAPTKRLGAVPGSGCVTLRYPRRARGWVPGHCPHRPPPAA
jgi:hypothetical protein